MGMFSHGGNVFAWGADLPPFSREDRIDHFPSDVTSCSLINQQISEQEVT